MSFWSFPSNDHGENKGINDSGVATFRGTPLKSLAREICQNSLDAAVRSPVIVEFNAFRISSSTLPGADDLKESFEKCSQYWEGQKSKLTKEFFTNATEKVSAQYIDMLRISDFNTFGLRGSKKTEDINTDWMRLTKSSGSSDKKGPAGGSFGIGKFAPFACSDFSTVFYSTYDTENVRAYQGVARLVTFKRKDKENTQGTGYYGESQNTPAYSSLNLDPEFVREKGQFGTDIYIAGYRFFGDKWIESIILSVIDGFLGAIWNEKLIVKIGEVEISKKTIGNLMETYREEITGYADQYYNVLISEKTVWFENDFMGLGLIKFGVLLGGQEMNRKAAMIRKTGMKIMDRGHLSGYIPFSAVMFIIGDKINEELRVIENPEHTEWQPDRSSNPIRARQIVKALNDYMKKKIEDLATQGHHDEMDAAGVGNLIPDMPENPEKETREEAVTNNVAEIEKFITKRKVPKKESTEGEEESSKDGAGGIEPEGNDADWIHPGGNTVNSTEKPPQPVQITDNGNQKIPVMSSVATEKLRVISLDKKSGKYVVLFVPKADGNFGQIEIKISAEVGAYDAPIISASDINGGKIEVIENKLIGLTFVKDKPLKINLQLAYSDYCSMEVKAYAY